MITDVRRAGLNLQNRGRVRRAERAHRDARPINSIARHGTFYYAGKALHDHERYGILTVENIITKSSNIGAAKIGIKMGDDALYEYIRDFGFGDAHGHSAAG